MSIIPRFLLRQFVRHRAVISYLFWGGMTTAVNYATYFVFTIGLHVNYLMSNCVAWAAGVVFGYVVNKIYVFRSKDWHFSVAFRECWQFVMSRVASGIVETGILKIFVDFLDCSDVVIKICANIISVIMNYVLSKFIIFRKRKALSHKYL